MTTSNSLCCAEQNGTATPSRMAADDHDGPVLVLAGDTPLLWSESPQVLLNELTSNDAVAVVGTAITEESGPGRVVWHADGQFVQIVEEKDATPGAEGFRDQYRRYAFDCRSFI